MALALTQPIPSPLNARSAWQSVGNPATVRPVPQAKTLTFGCSVASDTVDVSTTPRPSAQSIISNPDIFDSNQLAYDSEAVYSVDGKLTWAQKVCDFLIRQVYQRPTRSTVYKWLGNPCPFKRKANRLSCSEFTLVMIHRLGVIRGIWEGGKRLLRCNPMTVLKQNYDDPVIRINSLPWKYIPSF